MLREDAFPVRLAWPGRVEDEIGGRDERHGRVFQMTLPLVDDRRVKAFGVGRGLLCDLRLELAPLDVDSGTVEGRTARPFGSGALDLDAELFLGKKAPAGTLSWVSRGSL